MQSSYKKVSWVRHEDTHLLTTGMYRYIHFSLKISIFNHFLLKLYNHRYTPDTRFSSLHKPSSEHWVLELRDTQLSDQGLSDDEYLLLYLTAAQSLSCCPCLILSFSGDYECQISTTPVRSLKFLLQVVGKYLVSSMSKCLGNLTST